MTTVTISSDNIHDNFEIELIEKWLQGVHNIDSTLLENLLFTIANSLINPLDTIKYPLTSLFGQFLRMNENVMSIREMDKRGKMENFKKNFIKILSMRPSIAFAILLSINDSKLFTMYLLNFQSIKNSINAINATNNPIKEHSYSIYSRILDPEKPIFLFSHSQIHSLNPPSRSDWTINQKWLMKSITRIYGLSLVNLDLKIDFQIKTNKNNHEIIKEEIPSKSEIEINEIKKLKIENIKINKNIKFINCNHLPSLPDSNITTFDERILSTSTLNDCESLRIIMANTLNHFGFHSFDFQFLNFYNHYNPSSSISSSSQSTISPTPSSPSSHCKFHYQAACLAISALSGNKLEWLSNDALYDCLYRLNSHLTGSLLASLAIAFRSSCNFKNDLIELIAIHLPGFKLSRQESKMKIKMTGKNVNDNRNGNLNPDSSLSFQSLHSNSNLHPNSNSNFNFILDHCNQEEIQINLLIQSYAAISIGFLYMGSGDPNTSASLMKLFKGAKRLGNPIYPYNSEYYDCQYILMIAMSFGLLYVSHNPNNHNHNHDSILSCNDDLSCNNHNYHNHDAFIPSSKCLVDGPMYADINYLIQIINGEERIEMPGKSVTMIPAAIIALYGALIGTDTDTDIQNNDSNNKRLLESKIFANRINVKLMDRPFNFILKICCKLLILLQTENGKYNENENYGKYKNYNENHGNKKIISFSSLTRFYQFDTIKCLEIIKLFLGNPNEKLWLEYSYSCYCLAGISLYVAIGGKEDCLNLLLNWIEILQSCHQWFIYSIDWEMNKFKTPLMICHDYILLSLSVLVNRLSLMDSPFHAKEIMKLEGILRKLYQDPMDFNPYRSKMYHLALGFMGMGMGKFDSNNHHKGKLFHLIGGKKEHCYYLFCYLTLTLLNPFLDGMIGMDMMANGMNSSNRGENEIKKEEGFNRIIFIDYLWLLCTDIKTSDEIINNLLDNFDMKRMNEYELEILSLLLSFKKNENEIKSLLHPSSSSSMLLLLISNLLNKRES